MSRPRILIPTPTSFDTAYNEKCWPEYAAAVTAAGGEAIALALTHSVKELEALVAQADGILLPGSGADVSPERYGHDRSPASAEPDPLREQTDWALLEAAEQAETPVLGICFGMQSMNVFHGGTLIQDLVPLPVNHPAGRSVAVAHTAILSSGSRLASILNASTDLEHRAAGDLRLPVNSTHHQAGDIPGDTLQVVARCPDDGVIEAVEGVDKNRWLIGVQWHPERSLHTSAASMDLFRAFIAAAASR
ncbi:MAG: gamma-glutamyl-gamma-aminobutyrate hydrolase family protein [Janthinobacterium lividum]